MTSLYRQILLKAWQITKKYAYLWPIGLLAAFLGNGGEYQVLYNQYDKVINQPEIASYWQATLKAIVPQFNLSGTSLIYLFFLALIALIFFGLFLWLVISASGALVKGAATANNNESSTFVKLFQAGSRKFWPILGLNVVAKIIVYGILTLILGPLMISTFSKGDNSINLLIVMISFLILVPITIIVSLVTKYAIAFIMLENLKFKESFINAWRMFQTNWLVSLEMAFVLFVINILVSLVYILISLLIFSPFFFFAVLNVVNAPELFDVLMYVSVSLLLIISAFIGAWLATFQTSSWTLLFLKINGGERVYSKIVRLAATLPGKFKKAS
jgi:MFS family permease